MLRKLYLTLMICVFWVAPSFARDVHVNGYFKKNGTYVQPHYRSAPDGNPYNNFSTKGNVNPYTGDAGTVDPDNGTYDHRKSSGAYGYQSDSNSHDSFGNYNQKKNHDNSIIEEEPNEEDNH